MKLVSFRWLIFATIFVSYNILVQSCNATTPIVGPDVPEDKEVLSGSFESKWKRYSENQKHKGQENKQLREKEWRDTLWKGDRAHKQLVLWATDKPVRGISIDVTDLKCGESLIPASNISMRYESYVTGDKVATDCGNARDRSSVRIADALGDSPVTGVTSSDPMKLWITADIPADIPSGLYSGALHVKRGNEILDTYNLSFLISEYVLPETDKWKFHLDIWQFPFQLAKLCKKNGVAVEPFSKDYFTLVEPFYRKLADAGQKSITAYIKDGAFQQGQTMVDWTKRADGGWSFDYTKFDSFVEFMMGLGINKQINCFSMLGWDTSIGYLDMTDGKTKRFSADINDESFSKIWNVFLNSFKQHLIEKGWFEKTVIYMDEANENQMRTIVNIICSNDDRWKIGSAGSWYPSDLSSRLYEQSPIISSDEKSKADRVTFYTSCSQKHPNNYVTQDSSPAEMSFMSWYAMANGYSGYTRWAYDYWTNTDPLNAQDGSNAAGDFHFVYRSTNDFKTCAVLSSLRFELLRDGVVDYEKVQILGVNNFSSVMGLFKKYEGVDYERAVQQAESLVKKLSVK